MITLYPNISLSTGSPQNVTPTTVPTITETTQSPPPIGCSQYAGMVDKIVNGLLIFFGIYLAIVIMIGCIQEICWKITSSRQMTKLAKAFFQVRRSMLFAMY